MIEREPAGSLVNLSDIAEIELFILKRMRQAVLGEHPTVLHGSGSNFVGLRDWEPGDRLSQIDWPQSSLNAFSPIITREFEHNSTACVLAVADGSLSTRCGMAGISIASIIARSIATVGLSASFCYDQFGLITFDEKFRQRAVVLPRIGKSHVIHCLDVYERGQTTPPVSGGDDLTATIQRTLRTPSLVPVISDFLFASAPRIIGQLAALRGVHDVFLMMADARFAYDLPHVSAGWIESVDVETGDVQVISHAEFEQLAARAEEWQQEVTRLARESGLDIVRVGIDPREAERELVEFFAERRLRKF